ncbi:non-ribosomal peptide synthetase [Burkholderia plantarii]|uniref:Pyochelin synthase PchF (Non-ribosomal peptide synthase) n=1 Tax=Burkholderia plantarii TaxID=41899 RepID=A0A0B6S2V3_BURPL|nr:non-ribosomal peptide synthetase [Burkholderia plantarii]AJK46566.1 pyochelin synthase PchF (non-ribosomal peptide synthase) [Burkholderia plantarii]
MNLEDVLELCRERQIELWSEGGRLHYRAPAGSLDTALAETIRTRRRALIDFLSEDVWQPDPAKAHERFALTPVQAAYVLGRNPAFEFGGNACHLYVEYPLPASLDVARFEAAWNACVARHPMLRAIVEGSAWQRVLPDVPWQSLVVHELREADDACFAAHLAAVRSRLDHAVHALDRWPVLRPELSFGRTHAVLHMSVDFTLIDYASLQLLLSEWRRRYDEPHWKPDALDVTFRDYVVNEARARDRNRHAQDRAWWLARLEALPGRPDLPVVPAPATPVSPRFTHLHARLGDGSWGVLCATASQRGLSPAGVALAAFAEVVGRWSQTPTFCLNLTVLSRPDVHPRIGEVLGDFTALSLLAVDVTQGGDFTERARRIGAQMFDDLEHRGFTGIDVMRELARRRGKGTDLMPVVFTSGIGSVGRLLDGQGARLDRPLDMISQTPQVWLDCQATDQFGGLEIGWDVREALFPAGMPEAMFDAFVALLGRLASDDSWWTRRGDLVLPTMAEAEPPPVTTKPDAHLAAGFAARALSTPQATAIVDQAGSHSYRTIAQRAVALRDALERAGVDVGDRVAVLLPKGIGQAVAVLGIVQAGAAYVPIDVRQPALRQQAILESAQVRAIVTDTTQACEVGAAVRIDIDRLGADPGWPPRAARPVGGDALAYVIYTSGSTGEPKGVMLSHAAVCNTLDDINHRHEIGPDDVVLGLAELSFDLSVYDLFGAMAQGARVVLPDPSRHNDPSHWAELMTCHGVTVWNSVPAQGQMLTDYLESEPDRRVPGPRCVLWSGDWIPVSLPLRWWRRWPQSELFSLGGATEAAIWSIEHRIRRDDTQLASIPYGRALAGQIVEVLDALGRRCPAEVRGQIYIGGVGLADGYLNDPGRTAECFVRDAAGGRRYRTGDLGRYRADGSIEFLGRQDDQVKIRGYRIELAEIDAALTAHPLVSAAATVVHGDSQQRHLVSFVTLGGTAPEHCDHAEALNDVADRVSAVWASEAWPALPQIRESVARLEAACVASLAVWIGEMREPVDFPALCARLAVPAGRQHLLRHWLALLQDHGYLDALPSGVWQARPDAPTAGADAQWDRFASDAPASLWPPDLIEYFRRSAACLGEQLGERVSPAALMFPQGTTHIAEAMYSAGLHAQALHRGMAEAVRRIVEREPRRVWHVLEIGAGTAAATRVIVDALAPLVQAGIGIDYLFTDVSSYFLAAARERFAACPWVRFARFDMNARFEEQGIAPHSLDIVISSGALNNARDTVALLDGMREMSGADAWWVIQELTCEHPEISVSQALMMAPPDDARAALGQLFVHREPWLAGLRREAADCATGCTGPDDPLRALGYEVFVARVRAGAARIAPDELRAFMAQRLPAYMLPARIGVLERLPTTANGKIDRRRLGAIASIQAPPAVARAVVHAVAADALEARLIALWGAVLDIQGVTAEQDFFAAGGDSLLIAQLIGRLRADEPLARAHSFDRLLRCALNRPTPAAVAAFLRNRDGVGEAQAPRLETIATEEAEQGGAGEGEPASPSAGRPALRRRRVEPIRIAAGEGVPRVLVHEGLGTLHAYRRVMPALSTLGPLLGFAVDDTDDYLAIPARHVNATLGARYARALAREGLDEVDLLGYCSGGLIAIEMAKALLQLGVTVRSLDIVSSYRIPYLIEDERLILFNYAKTLGLSAEPFGYPPIDLLADALAEALKADGTRLAAGALEVQLGMFGDTCPPLDAVRTGVLRAAAGLPPDSTQDGPQDESLVAQREPLYRVFSHSVAASHWAATAPYVAGLRLFVPERCNPLIPQQRAVLLDYWQTQALGKVALIDLPGGHFDCLNDTFVTNHLGRQR